MGIRSCTNISSNENNRREVVIKHDKTLWQKLFGLPGKVEKYERFYGYWYNKDTGKTVYNYYRIEEIIRESNYRPKEDFHASPKHEKSYLLDKYPE